MPNDDDDDWELDKRVNALGNAVLAAGRAADARVSGLQRTELESTSAAPSPPLTRKSSSAVTAMDDEDAWDVPSRLKQPADTPSEAPAPARQPANVAPRPSASASGADDEAADDEVVDCVSELEQPGNTTEPAAFKIQWSTTSDCWVINQPGGRPAPYRAAWHAPAAQAPEEEQAPLGAYAPPPPLRR